MNNYFVEWVHEQMRERGWGLMDLHRASGLDAGGLSNLLAGKRNPGLKTCKALANAFGVSPDVVFQAAGQLGNKVTEINDAYISEINSTYNRFTAENKREAIEFFRMLIRLQKEQEEINAKQAPIPPDQA